MNQPSNAVSRGVLEALGDFDTPLLANTLDYISDVPTHELYMSGDICGVIPGMGPTVGVAVTCQLDTSTPGGEPSMDLYWQQLEEMGAMDLPAVWVVETVGSRPDHECVMGDGCAKCLISAGCVGVVTNGRVRDVQGIMSVGLPVYCRGTVVHHCVLRAKAINVPVSVGGITVNPGDVIHACEEGVIKIPHASVEAVLEKAPMHRSLEHQAHTLWRRTDISVAEKRRRAAEIYARNGFIRKG